MTQTKRFLVYVASNHKGLESERYEVTRQLARMGILSCGFPCREDTSPYDWNLARSQIEDADLFIMILGDDYGPMAQTGISYLHREFVHAQTLSKPVFSFVKNTLPAQGQTEEQRRLAGFHGLITKTNYRLWHLREELITHVKAAVTNGLSNRSGGWLKLDSVTPAEEPVAAVSVANTKVDSKQLMLKARQLINLQMSAKVYEAGNNTLEEITVPHRWDVIFGCVARVMASFSSEEKLRAALEALTEVEVKRRLLEQHPEAHAVDDIRVNRNQLNQLLNQWLEHDLIAMKKVSGRNVWKLTGKGVVRLSSTNTQSTAQ